MFFELLRSIFPFLFKKPAPPPLIPPPKEVKTLLDSWYSQIQSDLIGVKDCKSSSDKRAKSESLMRYCNRFIRAAQEYEGFEKQTSDIQELKKALENISKY